MKRKAKAPLKQKKKKKKAKRSKDTDAWCPDESDYEEAEYEDQQTNEFKA